tara:strand:- start:391 stop:582 length:192 start_codon:yes stop_codon:yes gene_type:complete
MTAKIFNTNEFICLFMTEGGFEMDFIVFFNGIKGLSIDIFFISFELGDSITCSTKLGRIIIEY